MENEKEKIQMINDYYKIERKGEEKKEAKFRPF